MFKGLAIGLAAMLSAGAALAAAPGQPEIQSWIITPGENSCRIDLELTARSGAILPVRLVSDGARMTLRFTRQAVPEQAFLPIHVDQKPYANLVLRTEEAGVGIIELSPDTQAALRKGGLLQVAWLTDEPMRASLSGSEQALLDLNACGAQVSARHRDRMAADADARARAEAEARAKELADVQLRAARAQADRLEAEADAERQRAANEAQALARAEAEAARVQREAEYEARRREQDEAEAYARHMDPYGRPTYRQGYDPYYAPGW